MTSFPALGTPLPGSALPPAGAPGTTAWRTMLALAVVLVLLVTTGWTTMRHTNGEPGPRAVALTDWKKGSVGGRQLPDPGAGAGTVARFFHSLSTGQRQQLADRYPLVVGNLGGAPVRLRYRANHTALVNARDTERKRMADQRLTDDGRQTAAQRMHRVESLLRPGRQILAFDPTGNGRAAEVFGNLAAARRISVVVPGVDTNVLSFEKSGHPYAAPVGMARALQHQQRAEAPQLPTATIAWADYTTPAGLGIDSASGRMARDGAKRLERFVGELPGSARVSLFCHSYGSVVCGVAARRLSARVTDISVTGSPGMRADTVADLGTRARVWSARDAGDWIADVPHMEFGGLGHGADPVSRAFGSRRVSADHADGHTGYYVPGTDSLANFADIGTGSYGAINCASADPDCTSGTAGTSARS